MSEKGIVKRSKPNYGAVAVIVRTVKVLENDDVSVRDGHEGDASRLFFDVIDEDVIQEGRKM